MSKFINANCLDVMRQYPDAYFDLNARASERIPDGFKPISQVHLTLTGNFNTTIDATCIVHLEPDGTINYTNNRSGNRVWTGTVTYTTVDDFPIVGNVPNGKLI